MKRLFLLLIFSISFISSIIAQNNAMYIYRNDGDFNAFLKSDIDSIRYSRIGVDSVYCDEWVVQEFYTPDSVYRIPISVIDSISFVTPEVKYHQNVMRMNESWLDYIIDLGSGYITFALSTPSNLLPHIGQVVVAESYEGVFAEGFAGRVKNYIIESDKILFNVDNVDLSDIYEHLVLVGKTQSYTDEHNNTRAKIWAHNTGVKFYIPNIEEEIGPLKLSLTPILTIDYTICIGEPNLKNYAKIVWNRIYEGEISINASFEKSYTPEPKWAKAYIPINTGVPGLYGKIRFGAFVRASGSMNISSTITSKMTQKEGFEYKNNWLYPINSCKIESEDPKGTISIDGSISGGLAIQAQFGIIYENLASADITAYIGPSISGNFSLSTDGIVNRRLYSALKDSKIELKGQAEIVPGYRFVGHEHEEIPYSLNIGYTINSWYIVPDLDNLGWVGNEVGGTLVGDVSRNLIMPVKLGWDILDGSENIYKNYGLDPNYRNLQIWPNNGINTEVDYIPSATHYTAYPTIELLGCKMYYERGVDVYRPFNPLDTPPIAITQNSTNITRTSATINCFYQNVYQNGSCGIEYNWNEGEKKIDIGSCNGSMEISLTDLAPGTTYNYRAFIDAYGQTYYGEWKTFSTEGISCTVNLSDFKVTKSRFKEGGFTNDGKTYDFRFDTSVKGTLETDDMSYIKEWGYVYEDPEGKLAEIPLSGTKEIVTRYAYFRNSAHSIARLYGYAYIEGIEKPVYYEVHDFPLVHNMAVANTGEYSNVTTSTATVLCSFENVPEGATCGIEYTDDNNWNKQSVNDTNKEGSHTVTLTGLQSGTKYEYRAFIDDAGQMYYGGQLNFTTEIELPDLSGTWNCTIYNDDDSILAECKYEFSSDHKVTHDGSDRIPEGEIGSWSIDANGKVGVNFSWTGGSWSHPVWYAETYSGQANSTSTPSCIEGNVYRAWAGTISEHGNTYKFKMTK